MIIWINGPFGGGKTTLAETLLQQLPNAVVFDPELIGFIIHKTVPESRTQDFQNFPMWREHVILFAQNLVKEFRRNLIIPMTLVNPEYLNEIHGGIRKFEPQFFHFFLQLEEETLRQRIASQIMDPTDEKNDQDIRQWRLDQVSRCLAAIPQLPPETILLNSGKESPEELTRKILSLLE